MRKTAIAIGLCLTSTIFGGTCFAQGENTDISVILNGTPMTFTNQPVLVENRVLVPMRNIFESLNMSVNWDDATKTIFAISKDMAITMQIGNTLMIKDGTAINLDVPPVIIEERTFVPLRAVADCFDAQTDWNQDTFTVTINTQKVAADIAVMEMEDGGVVEILLYPDYAPMSTANFKELVNMNYYDGLTFHRIIEGFMIQGGDGEGVREQPPLAAIKGEFSSNGFENPIKHERGVISMARTSDPNSAFSQFFICHQDAPHLDGEYAAFGRVVAGMEVVDQLAQTPVGPDQQTPITKPVIKSIRLKN